MSPEGRVQRTGRNLTETVCVQETMSISLRTSSLVRRTRPFALAGRGVGVLALGLVSATALTSCGSDDGSTAKESSAESNVATSSELADRQGVVCPEVLPAANGTDAEALSVPATAAPEFAATQDAWVCQYQVGARSKSGESQGSDWRRTGEIRNLSSDQWSAVDEGLAGLAPAKPNQPCTMDLGPRWMLVVANEGDLTGVVVDDFGCRDTRLTSDTFDAVAGLDDDPSVVQGVLSAPDSLLELLRSEESGANQANDELWDVMMGRLQCAGPASVFMHDMAEPDPDVTIQDALKDWERPGASFTIDTQTSDRAAVSLVVDSEVVQVLMLVKWESGGWAVEGGAEC